MLIARRKWEHMKPSSYRPNVISVRRLAGLGENVAGNEMPKRLSDSVRVEPHGFPGGIQLYEHIAGFLSSVCYLAAVAFTSR